MFKCGLRLWGSAVIFDRVAQQFSWRTAKEGGPYIRKKGWGVWERW